MGNTRDRSNLSEVNSLTVADLYAKLAYLVERGRGDDEVTFGWTDAAESAISDLTRAQLSWSDWSLRDVTWSEDDDYFTTLQFEPNHLDRVGALIEASSPDNGDTAGGDNGDTAGGDNGDAPTTSGQALSPSRGDNSVTSGRDREIAFEGLIREAWRGASDGCLNNTGRRKQDPCCGCVTNQLIGRAEALGEAAARLVGDHRSLVFDLFSQARGDGARFQELLIEHGATGQRGSGTNA